MCLNFLSFFLLSFGKFSTKYTIKGVTGRGGGVSDSRTHYNPWWPFSAHVDGLRDLLRNAPVPFSRSGPIPWLAEWPTRNTPSNCGRTGSTLCCYHPWACRRVAGSLTLITTRAKRHYISKERDVTSFLAFIYIPIIVQ